MSIHKVSLFAINDVMGTINDRMDSNAEIIFGTTSDSTLEKDEVKITIVATGFRVKKMMRLKNHKKEMKKQIKMQFL
ncbi:MAG: hypothetical protein U5K55_06545 [Aliarcobacter sp.]|nr:hypothetical protein [Aliarcobacter sp.]